MLPISKVDNDSRVSSPQDSSHCMLAMILNPSFINKMLGCRLEEPDIVCEHFLNLDPWVHSSVNSKKKKKNHQKAKCTYTTPSRREGPKGLLPSVLDVRLLVLFKDLNSRAGMDLFNHPAQPLHFASLERLK